MKSNQAFSKMLDAIAAIYRECAKISEKCSCEKCKKMIQRDSEHFDKKAASAIAFADREYRDAKSENEILKAKIALLEKAALKKA